MRLGYVILPIPDVAKAVALHERAFGLAPSFVRDSVRYAEIETDRRPARPRPP